MTLSVVSLVLSLLSDASDRDARSCRVSLTASRGFSIRGFSRSRSSGRRSMFISRSRKVSVTAEVPLSLDILSTRSFTLAVVRSCVLAVPEPLPISLAPLVSPRNLRSLRP